MRQLALGFALGALAAVFSPTMRYTVGSGEDERGAYNYSCVRVRAGRWTVEVDWWPES